MDFVFGAVFDFFWVGLILKLKKDGPPGLWLALIIAPLLFVALMLGAIFYFNGWS